MMNFNLDNLSEIIDDVLTEFCVTYPIPNFDNKEQLEHLRSVLEQFGAETFTDIELMEAISLAPKKFALEAKPKKKGDAGLEAAAAHFANKKYKNSDGKEVSFTTAINYGYTKGKENDKAHDAAMADFQSFLGQNQGKFGTMEKPVQPKEVPVNKKPAEAPNKKSKATPDQLKQLKTLQQKVAIKKAKDKEDIPQKTQKLDAPKSFRDAMLKNSRQKGDGKEVELEKKKQLANKAIDKAADKSGGKAGFLKLETKEGSGVFIDVKTKDIKTAINNLMSGNKLSLEDKKVLKLTTKLVTNPDNGDVKIYIAGKIAGRHPQQGYQSVDIATKNFPLSDDLRKFALNNNLNVGKASEGAIGKKVLTPLKVASSINKEKPIVKTKIEKTKNGVKFGDTEINYKVVPETKKLTDYFIQQGSKKDEAEERANLVIKQIKAYNGKIDDLYEVAKKSPNGEVDFNNFGKVDTPEDRKNTRNNIHKGIKLFFAQELKKYGDAFGQSELANKPENKLIFDTLDKLDKLNSKDLENDEKAREEYKAELDNLIIHLANSVDFKDAAADFTEIKAGLQFLSEGRRVLFPASENFQTADIIIIPDNTGWKDSGAKSYEEYLSKNFQFVTVSLEYVGGLSVKYKGGGGSANYNKIGMTIYKNKETQKRLLSMQKTYSVAYSNQQEMKKKDVDVMEKELKDTIDWAVKSGIITKAEAEIVKKIGIGQAANEMKANPNAGNCGGKENQAQLKRAIELQHIQLHLTAVINNNDMDYTRYGNFNEKLGIKGGKATSVEDDVVDGVKNPCYMRPHHNPGYTQSEDKDGCQSFTPTNQNPSHIVSKKPDLMNFKD